MVMMTSSRTRGKDPRSMRLSKVHELSELGEVGVVGRGLSARPRALALGAGSPDTGSPGSWVCGS